MWWLIKSNDDNNDKNETSSNNKENYETSNDDNDKVKARDSKITKKIWSKTITKIKTNKKEWYEIPKGITASSINPLTGEYKENGIVCFYEKGTEPNYIDKYSN